MNSTLSATTTGTALAESYRFSNSSGKPIATACALRLGDNLAHLHFLRALAKENPSLRFEHYAHRIYLPQMIEVVADLPNITLRDLAHIGSTSAFDVWKNCGGFWENHPLKNDYAEFMLDWFRVLAARMGLESPLRTPSDLLFDYPALNDQPAPFDGILIINSRAMSGQWREADYPALERLALDLGLHQPVATTESVPDLLCINRRGTVTDIGRIRPRAILMVSTGPSWPTFNPWVEATIKHRVALITHERLTLDPDCHHAATVADARRLLTEFGYLG